MRLSENPFSNPFASSERVAPGTPTVSQAAPPQASAPMATAQVHSQALPPVQSQPMAQSARYAAPAPMTQRPAPVRQTVVAQPAAQPKFRLVDTSRPPAPAAVASADPSRRVRPGMTAAQASPAPVRQTPVRQAPVQAAAPAPAHQPEIAKASIQEPEETASVSGDFRWPARGRVIAGFGANGGNEGINIAVPEGTPVKATEAGTVTYAGSEVKGYGNLVLIRHENGYVSAYAHNGSLNVKRGEQVKRGQVIATSGQTGNVTSPQLHFEIRKGATPVDPMKHLGG